MPEEPATQSNTPAEGGAPTPSRPSGVMDVQHPKAQPETTAPLAEPATPPTPPAAVSQPEPIEQIIAPPEKQPTGLPKHIEEHTDRLLAAHAEAHHKKPVVAIVVAIIVGLSLIALTVFAYMQTKDGTKDTGDTHTETPTHQEPKASTTDTDEATKQVDDTLGTIDDTKDLSETDLSDQSLGL